MDQSCVQTEMKNDFFDMYKKENMKKQRKMEMLPGKSGLAFAFAFKREVSTPECEFHGCAVYLVTHEGTERMIHFMSFGICALFCVKQALHSV
jgi:hypothetical protein